MNGLRRSISIAVLVVALGATEAAAQDQSAGDEFRWYLGGQAGMFVFRTPNQTRGAIPMFGGHALIKARRGGLYLAVEEALGDAEVSSYYSSTSGTTTVTFDNVRRFSFGLMAYPWKGPMTPYFGVGGGILNVVSPKNGGTDDPVAAQIGSSGFGSLMGGLNFRVGGLSAFGQYQIQTVPGYKAVGGAEGRLINGTVHSFVGGLRISLGSAREEL